MTDSTSNRSVLILTAIDLDWLEEEDDATLLGPWCIRYTARQRFAGRHPPILPDPWHSRAELRRAHAYVMALHERLVPPMADALNRLHGVNRTTHYWRIMLGGWLLSFLPAMYERYRTLEAAYRINPGFAARGLSPDCFVTPRSTMDLPRRIIDDHYNLQLYTRLLDGTGRLCGVRGAPPPAPEPVIGGTGWRGRLKRSLRKLGQYIPSEDSVLTHAALFPYSAEIGLMWRSRGRVRPLFTPQTAMPEVPVRLDDRSALRDTVAPDDEFTLRLREILPFELPLCFVEGYGALASTIGTFPPPPAAILSANGWYYDEPFKHWAASAHEHGTRLLGVQHGGNYGGGDYLPSEAFEIGLVDRFYTWGWTKPAYGERAWPMPAQKLVGRPPVGASNGRSGLLLATTHMTRYPLNFMTSVAEFDAYLDAHRRFVAALAPALRAALRVRLHSEDFGWDIAARWHDFAPDIPLDSWRVPFPVSLRDCRTYVCDHHSTTFLEALSADKPTVLFWDPGSVDLAPEYADRYAGLRSVGILHDTPEGAAQHLEATYADVERWWRDPAVQQARRHFCDALGRTAADALAQWAAELQTQRRAARRDWPRRAN